MKKEALKLADELLRDNTQLTVESAYMIRRLVEELDKQEPSFWTYSVNGNDGCFSNFKPPDDAYDEGTLTPLYTTPQTKPLSDEEIRKIHCITDGNLNLIKFARAIEERHGIK